MSPVLLLNLRGEADSLPLAPCSWDDMTGPAKGEELLSVLCVVGWIENGSLPLKVIKRIK